MNKIKLLIYKQLSRRRFLKAFLVIALLLSLGLWATSRVIRSGATPPVPATLAKGCQVYQDSYSRETCWNDLISQTLTTSGLEATYRVFSYLYDHDPGFSNDCHEIAHKLGAAAYRIFTTSGDFKITAATSSCAYGFYHGFMELFLRGGASLDYARKLCQIAEDSISKENLEIGKQCYHGIGHGSVDIHNQGPEGNLNNLVSPAYRVCERVSPDSGRLKSCAAGVFNAVAVAILDPKYKFTLDQFRPFHFCEDGPEAFQQACYLNITEVIRQQHQKSFSITAGFIKDIPKAQGVYWAVSSLASNIAVESSSDSNYHQEIGLCRSLGKPYSLQCLDGFTEGLSIIGKPGSEEKRIFEFCHTPELSLEEKDRCFTHGIGRLKELFNSQHLLEVCKELEARYNHLCAIPQSNQ